MSVFGKIKQTVNVEWLTKDNNKQLSSRARELGYKFFCERYLHGITVSESNGKICVHGKCYRSMRKNEAPHKVKIEIFEEKITESLCSCTAG